MDKHPHEFVHDDHHVSPESIKEGYEVSDLQAHLAVYSLIGLFLLLFLGGVVFSIFYLGYMQKTMVPTVNGRVVSMLKQKNQAQEDFPKLQQNPEKDKEIFFKAANEQLNSFGKVKVELEGGKGEQIVQMHIPIDNAIKLVASGKVPYRQIPKIAIEGVEPQAVGLVGGK